MPEALHYDTKKSKTTRINNRNAFWGLTHSHGFTLAEVLITLGIIGIVAAMTLPTLIQNYKNRVVETRLKKFYSTMNQAVLMAEAQYGDKKNMVGRLSRRYVRR